MPVLKSEIQQKFLEMQNVLMNDDEHRWWTGEAVGHNPDHNELAMNFICKQGKAKVLREWFDEHLTADQQNLMLEASSGFELYLLVYCGYLPDPLGWFAEYPANYLDWLTQRG